MDFTNIKQSFTQMTKKIGDKKNEALDLLSNKVNDTGVVISDFPRFVEFIESTKNVTKYLEKTGENREFTRTGAVIITPTKGEWYNKLVTRLPVLFIKGFSQSTPIKIADSNMPGFVASAYEITEFPTLILLEDGNIKERIMGKRAIEKVVKKLSLSINK